MGFYRVSITINTSKLLQCSYGIHMYSYVHKIITLFFSSVADTVSFNQSVYNVDEENEIVQIVLVLSSSLPNDTIVQVISDAINATGKYVYFKWL